MTAFTWNLALALVWSAALGSFSLANLAAGFVLGFGVMAFAGQRLGGPGYARKAWRALGFAGFFLTELALASVRVAVDVLTPRHRARPGIVAVPLDAETDAEITLFANLMSLTPGSLSLELSEDRSTLFVHVMFLDDADGFRRSVKEGFERRVLELMR